MDPTTFFAALERLFSVGGVPLAIFGLIAWTWLQDRRKRPDDEQNELHREFAEFRKDVTARLARIEAHMEVLWQGKR